MEGGGSLTDNIGSPLMKNTLVDCTFTCILEDNCQAFTWNAVTQVCSLGSAARTMDAIDDSRTYCMNGALPPYRTDIALGIIIIEHYTLLPVLLSESSINPPTHNQP